MGQNSVLKILTIVFAVIDVLFFICGGVYLITASKNIKELQITADFNETEISTSNQYSFTVSAKPSKASLKKVKCVVDDPSATFEMKKDGKAILITGANEGTVTVYVEYKKIKSNVLTFQVADLAARAQAEAEAAAQAAAAEEAAAAEAEIAAVEEPAKMYVKMKGDNVNVRSQNNTDCDILGKAKQGEVFEKIETIDDWTHIIYNGQDGYIKSEYLVDISEDEALGGATTEVGETSNNTTTQDTANTEEDEAAKRAADEAAVKAAQEAALKAAEEQAKKQEEENAKKAAEEAAAQAAAAQAAAAAAAAAGSSLECADGVHTFTQAQYNFLKGFWYRDGQTSPDDWKVYAHKHTYAECIQICQIEGGL